MIYQYDGRKDKCPLPLVKMRLLLKKLTVEDECIIQIFDAGSLSDIPKYLTNKGYCYSTIILDDGAKELHIALGK